LPLLGQVLEAYPKKVKLVAKNFPLQNHKFARKAAEAALAANKMDKYWEFHDKLFDNHKQLNEQKIKQIAIELGFDWKEFEKHMKDPAIKAIINSDMQEGQRIGVRGTPAIFINGRKLKNRSMNGFKNAIEKELKNRS
jgi:protein-disulfide isomerase